MSKCPFWSTKKEKVSCNDVCPMNGIGTKKDSCVFRECESDNKVVFKDIVEYDYAYEDTKILGLHTYFEEEAY
ncbi:MAG: hypothetical protein ACRC7N_13105 [Clostridium sp.]